MTDDGILYSDGDYPNQDTDYNPEDDGSTSHSSEGSREIENEKQVIEEDPENVAPPTRQTGRKRLRRPDTWERQRAK